jgi:molecular chaperone GrpE (heat shock protein)
MFEDIIQILEGGGVLMQKSNQGDKRNPRYCQVADRVTTDNPDLHDTVAKIHSTGFYIENRVLIKELVDIYLYSGKTEEQSDKL